MNQVFLDSECMGSTIWVDWRHEIVSFHEAEGFEPIPFTTQACWQKNLRILMDAGFRFQ